jgi:hypothetical protein
MKNSLKVILLLSCLYIYNSAFAYKYYSPNHPVHVKQYFKNSGKYVNPYYRSKPNQHSKEYNKEMRSVEP